MSVRAERSRAVGAAAALAVTLALAAVATAVATAAEAQGGGEASARAIAQRVAAVRTGTVWMSFAAMPGTSGNGRGGISVRTGGRNSFFGSGDLASKEWEDECEPGPVRVSLDVSRGTVTALRTYVGGRWRGTAALDLGTVPPAAATDYLLGLAERGEGRPAKDAIFPASIAEGAVVWPRLLTLAKDAERPRQVRESALFWVGQAVGDAVTAGLQEIVDDPSGDREVRKSAVFSLSQRPKDESVPALIRIARTHKDPELRRSAVFWLGQSNDPRAVGFFEEVLLKGR